MARLWIVFIASLLAFNALAEDGAGHGDEERPIKVGSAALPFGPLAVINQTDAGAAHLTFSGKPSGKSHVTVLSFFAEWCAGCVNELPVLKDLDALYRNRGVQVVTVSVDREKDATHKLREMITREGLHHTVALDPSSAVLRRYQGENQSLPYLFVIGPDGVVADLHEGFGPGTEPELRKVIDRLLTPTP